MGIVQIAEETHLEITSDKILELLNKMISACEPIKFDDFNKIIKEKEHGSLERIEKEDNRIGIRLTNYNDSTSGFAISTASMFSTITDVCFGKRLAFIIDDNSGYITGFKWYEL